MLQRLYEPFADTDFQLETSSPAPNPIPLATAFSAYARLALQARPRMAAALVARVNRTFGPAALGTIVMGVPAPALPAALRELRREVLLAVMERDLDGRADLVEVTGAMTALAEIAIASALAAASEELAPRYGLPHGEDSGNVQQLHVVGMGKLGGGELNVSSDIDLIFVYPEEGTTRGGTLAIANQEYFEHLGRRLIAIVSEVTSDGYVFRVDMRLRPWGDGPLAMGFAALEDYLVAQGRDWERYAWIKGRVLTGDRPDELMAIVTPFVYRRYLDFGAIESLKGLHTQIKREVARRELADHVKLGPGGIREIEFVAQAQQLIRAGRDARLRLRPTVQVLGLLGTAGLLPPEVVADLVAAYDFLRRVEHRLQYAEDLQTHTLPRSDQARLRLAHAMGCADWIGFELALDTQRANVSRHFEQILGSSPAAPAADAQPSVAQRLAQGGFAQPDELVRLIDNTLAGAKIRRLADATRSRLDALLPRLIDASRACPMPDLALKRLLAFIETIASRSSYLALLTQSEAALERLANLLAASEWAARYLTLHPILLDELLDERTLYSQPDMEEFSAEAAARLARLRSDLEAQMNALREAHHAAVFRLLAQDVQGVLSVERLADHLSELADRALDLALTECWRMLKGTHRVAPEFAVIAYGKLGGKELGYASDLDLVFIYDDADEHAAEIYARLAQRLITFIDTQTTAGRLFEIDTRLRPDGDSGLLVTSLAAFTDYQRRRAWVWEHQALTRARHCAGDARIGAAFEAERRHMLALPRNAATLIEEVRSMRKKMHAGHPNRSKLFDLKHDAGGMVDIEFCVQTLVLLHARNHPQLFGNLGNIALLRLAAEAGLIPAILAQACGDAYRTYRKHQHALRLNNVEYARVPLEDVAREIRSVGQLWESVAGQR